MKIFVDEFAFLKHNDTVYASASPALTKASEAAERNGTPFGKLITTTPNMLDDPSGFYCKAMIDSSLPFDEKWYDWSLKEVKDYIKENSGNNFVYIEFSYKQLGRDDEWFTNQCKDLNNDMLKIKREILLKWTYANNSSPFSEEQLDTIDRYVVKDPVAKIRIKGKYVFNMLEYMHNMKNKSWIIGIDIAGGLSNDYTSISVIDPFDLKCKLEFKSNTLRSHDLISILESLISDYLPNGVLMPERNSIGVPVIEMMLRSPILHSHVYYEIREKLAERDTIDVKVVQNKKFKKETKIYGLFTDRTTRKIMTEELLMMLVDEKPNVLISDTIFNEMKCLIRDSRGRIDHRKGCHDDSLFSYLIGVYGYLYGNNVNKFFKVIGNNNADDINNGRHKNHRRVFNNVLGTVEKSSSYSFTDTIIEQYQENKYNEECLDFNEETIRKNKKMSLINSIMNLNKKTH